MISVDIWFIQFRFQASVQIWRRAIKLIVILSTGPRVGTRMISHAGRIVYEEILLLMGTFLVTCTVTFLYQCLRCADCSVKGITKCQSLTLGHPALQDLV
jgi:hypothetical protein